MFNYSVEKLVDNMVVADQTELVNRLLDSEIGLLDYDHIQWPAPDSDVDDDEYRCPDIYSWKLINPWYRDIIEGKAPNYGMAYLEYGGQLWLGKTSTNSLTLWHYLRGLCKEEELVEDSSDEEEEDNSDEEEELAGDYCYGASNPTTVIIYTMAGGGAHWWNYEVHYDEDGQQAYVSINDINGKHYQRNQVLFYYEDQPDQLRLEDDDFDEDKWIQLEHYV